MDANSSAKYVSCGAAYVVSGLWQVKDKKCENVTHTHRCLYLWCEESQGMGFLHKRTHRVSQTHTCQMENYYFSGLYSH